MQRQVIGQILACLLLFVGIAMSGTLLASSLTDEAQECIDCHEVDMPAMVNDWRSSRHAANDISYVGCHVVDADSPMGTMHQETGLVTWR